MGVILKVNVVPIKYQAGTEGRWRALSVNNFGVRRGWAVTALPQLLYPCEIALVPIIQEVAWTSWLLWMSPEILPEV